MSIEDSMSLPIVELPTYTIKKILRYSNPTQPIQVYESLNFGLSWVELSELIGLSTLLYTLLIKFPHFLFLHSLSFFPMDSIWCWGAASLLYLSQKQYIFVVRPLSPSTPLHPSTKPSCQSFHTNPSCQINSETKVV